MARSIIFYNAHEEEFQEEPHFCEKMYNHLCKFGRIPVCCYSYRYKNNTIILKKGNLIINEDNKLRLKDFNDSGAKSIKDALENYTSIFI